MGPRGRGCETEPFILQDNGCETTDSEPKKTFGETYGEATGVSAPPGTPTSRRPVLNAPEGPIGAIVSGA